MLEALEGSFDVTGHEHIPRALLHVVGTCPVSANLVMFSNGADSIFGITAFGVFATKIINNKGECNITLLVVPQSVNERDGMGA
jgi:hypothetical protein